MFFALHFMQVGKLHDPSKLLLQPYKLIYNCVRLRNIIKVSGHLNRLSIILIHTFLCQFAEEY